MELPGSTVEGVSREALAVSDALGNLACAYVEAVVGETLGFDDARYTGVLRSQPALVRALLEAADSMPGAELPRWVLMASY